MSTVCYLMTLLTPDPLSCTEGGHLRRREADDFSKDMLRSLAPIVLKLLPSPSRRGAGLHTEALAKAWGEVPLTQCNPQRLQLLQHRLITFFRSRNNHSPYFNFSLK